MTTGNFSRRFAIVGLGVTKVGHLPGYSPRTLQAEAARLAIEDAGLKAEDIDGAINAKADAGGGTGGDWTDAFPRILGLPFKFYFHIARGGAGGCFALMSALSFLEFGIAKYVLIAHGSNSWSTTHRGSRRNDNHTPRSGIWGAPLGEIAAASHHSFFASRHMHEFGTTSRQLGAVAVAMRRWACLNPAAYMHGRSLTIEEHQESPLVVYPYHLLDICLQSDGGTAFIVTTAERARDCRKPPVYILGTGCGEAGRKLWWEKGNYTSLDVAPARDHAFQQAGIELKDIDVAELYDCFTMEVLMQLEGYGWCKKGEGGPFVEKGSIAPGGAIPVNTGGGLLSSHHLYDFTPLAEAIIQVRGEGGARQVKNARTVLATGHGGEILRPGMCSTHTCVVLGK